MSRRSCYSRNNCCGGGYRGGCCGNYSNCGCGCGGFGGGCGGFGGGFGGCGCGCSPLIWLLLLGFCW